MEKETGKMLAVPLPGGVSVCFCLCLCLCRSRVNHCAGFPSACLMLVCVEGLVRPTTVP